jgi:glutathione S-transferase
MLEAALNKLVIYTSPSAFPNPQRVRLLVHEKGIADQLEERVLDMAPVGEQRGWRHLARNPWGETPTLELPEGGYLAESVAIARYLDGTFPGRKILGETPLEQAQDTMWNDRVWVQILYRLTTLFHVSHQGLGPKLELTHNPQWGEHCRKEAIGHAALVERHLADGRDWLLGGADPTFADITLCTAIAFSKFGPVATPLDERFEQLDRFWQRWKTRSSFRIAYADGGGLQELDEMKTA